MTGADEGSAARLAARLKAQRVEREPSSSDGHTRSAAARETEWTPRVRTTLREVARRAGVSPTTVSRVLNGKAIELSEATRLQVMRVAREMHYRPNGLAVGLRKSATRMIGLIIPDILDSYFHIIARAVADTALDDGFVTIVCNTDRVPAHERMVVELLSDRHVDGIIFAGGGVDGDAHLRDGLWAECPVVAIGPHQLPFPTVQVDNVAAIRSAVAHLVDGGAASIACLGGRPNWLIHQERLRGYLQGLADAGRVPNEALIWTGDFGYETGYAVTRDGIAAGVPFDGIVAFNDNAAIGAIEALRAAGRNVPEDVLVFGCDDIPLARLVRPTLSSVSFSLRDFGAAATRTLLAMIAGHGVAQVQEFPFQLVVRESSTRDRARTFLP
jgi:LacI family transcriptional regulator